MRVRVREGLGLGKEGSAVGELNVIQLLTGLIHPLFSSPLNSVLMSSHVSRV